MKIAIPGKIAIQGLSSMNTTLARKSQPQLGGCAQSQEAQRGFDNDRRRHSSVPNTMTGAMQLGRICRKSTR